MKRLVDISTGKELNYPSTIINYDNSWDEKANTVYTTTDETAQKES